MENASKALIIAGEILIGVLILSLASYIIMTFGNFSKNMSSQMDEVQIAKFNVNFTECSNKANISAQTVVSLVNLARQTNSEYQASAGDEYFIDVWIDGRSMLNSNINEFLDNNRNDTYYYCNLEKPRMITSGTDLKITAKTTNKDITYQNRTGRINKIEFHSMNKRDYPEYIKALIEGNNIVWDIT